MSDDPAMRRRAPVLSGFSEEGSCRPNPGERVMWLAVVKRALADAKGMRVGSDSETGNYVARRQARKWFRNRSRSYIGGWGYVIDALGLPRCVARRIEHAAKTDGGSLDTLFDFELNEELLQD